MKFYLEVSFSENVFCCLLQNSKLPPGIIDSKWEGLSEFITSTGAAEKSSKINRPTSDLIISRCIKLPDE